MGIISGMHMCNNPCHAHEAGEKVEKMDEQYNIPTAALSWGRERQEDRKSFLSFLKNAFENS